MTRLEHAVDCRFDIGSVSGKNLPDRASDMILSRHAVDLGELVIDPHIAIIAVEERQSDRRALVEGRKLSEPSFGEAFGPLRFGLRLRPSFFGNHRDEQRHQRCNRQILLHPNDVDVPGFVGERPQPRRRACNGNDRQHGKCRGGTCGTEIKGRPNEDRIEVESCRAGWAEVDQPRNNCRDGECRDEIGPLASAPLCALDPLPGDKSAPNTSTPSTSPRLHVTNSEGSSAAVLCASAQNKAVPLTALDERSCAARGQEHGEVTKLAKIRDSRRAFPEHRGACHGSERLARREEELKG